MGEVRIRDGSRERRFVTDQVDGAVELRLDDGRPRLVVPEDGASTAAGGRGVERSVERRRSPLRSDPWWFLYVPTLAGAAFVAATRLGLLERFFPRLGPSIAAGLGAVFLLTAWTGTVLVLTDAARLRETDADWQPPAWGYVAGGGVVTTGYLLASAGPLPSGGSLLPVVVGAALVGGASAAAVSGPLYLHRRRRRVGPD